MKIPLSKPHIPSQVHENIKQVLSSGKLSGDGPFCHKVEKKLEELLAVKHVLLTSSCTHSLEMSMSLLNAQENDEVILPSFTFSSTANAVLVAGLRPVFCEIDPATMNMDVNDVANKVTKRTRAIIPVHYAGVACEMDKIKEICKDRNIMIVEDAAQAIGAKYREKNLGTIGDMSAISFHDTKNVICGEGGAFLTDNEELCERAQIIREKGTNRSQFLRGQVDKYTWIEKGSSYILPEPLAAILAAEVDMMQELNGKRGEIYHFYMKSFQNLEQKNLLTLPIIPSYCESNYHIFHILLPTEARRNALMSYLREKGIGATFHYIPLHSAPAGKKLGYKNEDLPLTEKYSACLLRLPLFFDMTQEEVQYIVDEVHRFFKN